VHEAVIDVGHVHAAAAIGDIKVLKWCVETTPEHCTPQQLTELLQTAAASNQLAVCKWLREQEAEWPAQLHWYDVMWSRDTVAWAHAEGCTAADPRACGGETGDCTLILLIICSARWHMLLKQSDAVMCAVLTTDSMHAVWT
jgi:hypothetical protein